MSANSTGLQMNSVVEEVMKRCSDCKTGKPHSAFAKNKSQRDGFNCICRDCAKIRAMTRGQTPAMYLHDLIMSRVRDAKKRAAAREQPFDPDFFNYAFVSSVFHSQDELCCPLCFLPFAKRKTVEDGLGFTPDSLSFDCVIPDRGYTRGNVMAICYNCNRLKNNSSPDWFRRVMDAIDSRMEIIYRMPCIDPPGCTP